MPDPTPTPASAPPPDEATADAPPTPRPTAAWWAAVVLAAVALLLTSYLTYASVTGDGKPMGCGDDAGCGAVLGTKWSMFFGLPVSSIATGLYLYLIAVLLIQRRLGGDWLAPSAVVIIGAALWFTYLQLFEIKAICWYCLADHTVGLAFALVILTHTAKKHLWSSIVVGVLATVILAGVQTLSDDPTLIVEGGSTQAGQSLTVLDGRLTLNLAEEIILPGPDRSNNQQALLIKIFDYHCPHCHAADRFIHDLGNVALVLLPTPLNTDCNPYMSSTSSRFAESCDLTRLVLAVQRADPEAFPAFHAFLNNDGWPHPLEDARAFAETLVSPLQLDLQLNDPALDATIRRNTEAWGSARDADLVGGLPVFIAPHGPLTFGRVGDGSNILRLLQAPPPETSPGSPPDTSPENSP